MKFCDSQVQAVFEIYEERLARDDERMRELGPASMAVRDELLIPVGAEVGWVLHSLIIARAPKVILELGTSYGYSTLFMANAAREVGAKVITMDVADYKQAHAREQLTTAGLVDYVDFRCGDALAMIGEDEGPFDFILLDIWKERYTPCFQAFYPKLSEEAIIVSDNMIFPESARPEVRTYRAAVKAKADLQTTLLPIGQGIELTVKWTTGNGKL